MRVGEAGHDRLALVAQRDARRADAGDGEAVDVRAQAEREARVAREGRRRPQQPRLQAGRALEVRPRLGIEGGVDLTKGVRLFVDARNLTDENYISTYSTITDATVAATNVFYPGEGRSVFAGLKIAF